MTRSGSVNRIVRFSRQPDVRSQPGRALYRRVRWRLHWSRPAASYFHLGSWVCGLSIDLPRSGSAAQVYYRTFSSPHLARAMTDSLEPGMSMLDIGAHVGEYSLLAATLVGLHGQVHAIEPQPELAELIGHNAKLNAIENVQVHAVAVADRTGTSHFEADGSSGGGWLRRGPNGSSATPCTTLDELVATVGGRVDFVKLDAAGNELSVLAGGRRALSGAAPRIAYKLYHPRIATERFGHDSLRALEVLAGYGYEQRLLTEAPSRVRGAADVMEHLGSDWYSVPILATQRAEWLPG